MTCLLTCQDLVQDVHRIGKFGREIGGSVVNILVGKNFPKIHN